LIDAALDAALCPDAIAAASFREKRWLVTWSKRTSTTSAGGSDFPFAAALGAPSD
jgi:hypothetical protein